MNIVVVALVVVAVVVVAVALLLRKKGDDRIGESRGEASKPLPISETEKPVDKATTTSVEKSERLPEQPASSESKKETSIETAAEAPTEGESVGAAPGETEVPESIPSGVRLDDAAEDKAAAELEKERKERKLKRLRNGLAPTRGGLISKIGGIFKSKKELSPEIIEELEEVLLTSDVGAKTARKLLDTIQSALEKDELSDAAAAWSLLEEAVRQILSVPTTPWEIEKQKPFVIMVVGVNGVGKTTTIGKLATKFAEQNKKVVLAAADTFRAAAVNQLTIWGRRAEAEVVKSKEGADPSSVVFEAVKKAKEIGADIVIADTAGRLHTQQPLMEELKKIHRVMGKAHEGAPHEVLLVLDATTGQNAIQQVAMFKDTLEISGLVLTKLDGTAKGGVIIGVCHEHAVPVRFIGIGESKEDLREFDVADFIDALFVKESERD